ncbi:unnamed protein product [Lactuca virosa]|uniref:Uncharacterized protein n=1 Tax=Lactuca virosa TaxID=75947 RepID=A0AAU9PR65_9ASTR|nr:unnamed protein product [Lactuca virosa]
MFLWVFHGPFGREDRYQLEAVAAEVVVDPGGLVFVSLPIDLSSTSYFAIASTSCSATRALSPRYPTSFIVIIPFPGVAVGEPGLHHNSHIKVADLKHT